MWRPSPRRPLLQRAQRSFTESLSGAFNSTFGGVFSDTQHDPLEPLKEARLPVDEAPRRPAVFLDKDGTLVEDVPYNVDPALLRFTPNALPALQLLASAGYALIVVTNQPGIAMGRFNRLQLALLQKALIQRVQKEAGVAIEGFYACPHAPEPNGAPACLCRKPAPGLLRQAALMHRVDLGRSWMVGDILNDVEAGRRAGCRTVLLDVGNETEWRASPLRLPHHRCADLLEAARAIVAAGPPLPREPHPHACTGPAAPSTTLATGRTALAAASPA